MFWIAFGDVHESLGNIYKVEDIKEADAILVSGDLTNVGSRSRAASIVDEIRSLNSRVYAQIGNMDTREVERYLDEEGVNIHNRMVPLAQDIHLLGLGYSTPTPFSTPSEVSEKQMDNWLENITAKALEASHLIFLSHTPPFNTSADRLGRGNNVGSRAVRNFIEKVQPGVCVTGHIHEARSVDHIGRTTVINPGVLAAGGYVRISFDGGQLKAELREV